MRQILILLIVFYQEHISPIKGYRCAYGVFHGSGTCSKIIKNIIERDGLFLGWSKIKAQFSACSDAYKKLNQDKKTKKRNKRHKKDKDGQDWCSGIDPCQVIECMPVKRCRGDGSNSCDLPCDCSPF